MTRLSVNINKVALLRNARGGKIPDVFQVAADCEKFGAQGITVHPRPDERHIRYADVFVLKPLITTEFNIEGYPSKKFLALVTSVKPHQVTLVPDPPGALTSNAGWDTKKHLKFLQEIIARLQKRGIRTSIFVAPRPKIIEYAAKTGTNRVELYTEPYAKNYSEGRKKAIIPFIKAAKVATEAGLGINAGHDLNLINLKFFAKNVPNLLEVSIGHALVADALYLGLEKTIKSYLRELSD